MLKEVTLTELDDGTTVNNIEEVSNFTPIIQTVKVEDSQQYFKFTLNYIENDLQGRDTFYYQITEINSSTDDTRDNTKVYIAKVEVTESSSGGIDAKVTKMWSAGSINGTYAVEEEHFAEYVNYVVNALKISKTVKGSTASLDNEYEFVITLKKGIQGDENVGNAFGAYLEASYPVKRISTDAARAGTWNLSFDGDGEERTAKVYLKDGESIIISNLPVGTKWSITENTPDGFKVTSSGTVGVTASGATASGTITKTESEVSFTNTQFYELPESGGFGTFKYTMAGLLLLCSAAYLLYKQRKCMRRVG